MADEDEDFSHLRALEAPEDDEETEKLPDYGNIGKVGANATSTSALALPKRGEKDFESHSTNLQLSTLENSRLAMHNVLSWRRTHTLKNHVLAIYHADSNMAYVNKVKTSHFATIGRSRGGKEWLLPEEALFMIERGSLDCRWPIKVDADSEEAAAMEDSVMGAPMSLQGAYAAFLGFEEGVGGKLTMEMYTVYAGLKRSGYVVFRHGNWNEDRAELVPLAEHSPKHGDDKKGGVWSRFFTEVWRRISEPTYVVPASNLASGPFIRPGLYRSYVDIYRLLQTHPIPTYARTAPPSFALPSNPTNSFRLHFDVWKSGGPQRFRKTDRPPPDFRVCVINARETSIPTAAQLNDLLATVPDDAPKEGKNMFQKLKEGKRNVVLAVVDNGIPSYIRVADAPFSEEKVYERPTRGRGGKGGGRGRNGGRARGRGRGK